MNSPISGIPAPIIENVFSRMRKYARFESGRVEKAIDLLNGPSSVLDAKFAKYDTDVTIHDFATAKHTIHCNCDDRQRRGNYCKHIIALFGYLYLLHETENAAATIPTSGENVIDDPTDAATETFERKER